MPQRSRPRVTARAGGVALVLVTLLAGCDQSPTSTAEPSSTTSPGSSTTTTTVPAPSTADKLGLSTGWGPSQEQLDRAAKRVRRMPLPDLAGQVIVASYAGTGAPLALVRRLHLAGVVAFADNVTSTDQIRAVNRRLGREIRRPLLVSVDQEGGPVERVKGAATRFPAFMSVGAVDEPAFTRRVYSASARELAGLGFNLDFAPVADVTSPQDVTIGARSAGDDPQRVADQAVAAAQGFLRGGVLPVLKHFPGHGTVAADSHRTLPVQNAPLARLRRRDLVPYAAAIDAGLPIVMVGHLDVRAVAPGVPSSLSRKVVTGLLRDDLGFQGLVVTDALDMQGVAGRFPSARSAPRALAAGVDLVLMPPDPVAARQGIIRAVRTGALTRQRLRQAAARVLAVLDYRRSLASVPTSAPGAARSVSRALSTRALSVVAGPCSGRLVGGAVTAVGDPGAVATFTAAARSAGLAVLVRQAPPASLANAVPKPTRAKKERKRAYERRITAWKRAEGDRRRNLDAWRRTEEARLASASTVAFAGAGSLGYTADVVVATDSPYVLGRSRARSKIATFGSTPAAAAALVEIILGRKRATGRIPVSVRGQSRGCPTSD